MNNSGIDLLKKYDFINMDTGKTCAEFNKLVSRTHPIKYNGMASLNKRFAEKIITKHHLEEIISYIISGCVMCDLWTQHKKIKISENEKEYISIELGQRLERHYRMLGV